jgi:hypothetical protein
MEKKWIGILESGKMCCVITKEGLLYLKMHGPSHVWRTNDKSCCKALWWYNSMGKRKTAK